MVTRPKVHDLGVAASFRELGRVARWLTVANDKWSQCRVVLVKATLTTGHGSLLNLDS